MHCAGGHVLQHDAFLNHAPDLDRAPIFFFYFPAVETLPVLQEDDQSDASRAECQVLAWLEDQAGKNPARLKYKGYQKLVRAFSEHAGVPAEEASKPAHTS